MNFTIDDIFQFIRKRFLLFLFSMFIGAIFFFLISSYILKPAYTASVEMYVFTNDEAATDDYSNLNNLNYAQKVVTTYITFLQTKIFYQQVADKSGLTFTPAQIKSMTKIQPVYNTEIFQINVTSYDPYDSFHLVETMQEVAPELIHNIKTKAEILVVDPVVIPLQPSSPNIMKNTLLGGALGLVTCIMLAFLCDILNIKVKNPEALAVRYNYPILGVIPCFGRYKRKQKNHMKSITVLEIQKSINTDTKNISNKNFMMEEAYRSLRTNLRFILRTGSCKKIIISSPVPEEGKSITSTNLAITLAQSGVRVLLIDCDLRKGRLGSIFNLRNVPGISDVLSGMADVKKVIQPTVYENLSVITMGSIPPNPADLLASEQMEHFITGIEKEYQFIFYDTPPVNVVSDSLNLSKLADGVILILREGVTSYAGISGAIAKYELIKGDILGFVMNGFYPAEYKNSRSQNYYKHLNKNPD